MAGGNDNLIPVTERTKEEAREISRKGGIKSGEARREKAKLREIAQIMMDNIDKDLSDEDIARLEALGLDTTNRSRVAVALLMKALGGDTKAIQLLGEITGEYTPKQELDIDGGLNINVKIARKDE